MDFKKFFRHDANEELAIQIRRLKPRFLLEKEEFKKCTTPVERLNYFLDDEEEVEHIKTKIKNIKPSPGKSDEKAVETRTFGNYYYKRRNYGEAIAFYNESLAWGNSDEMVSLAYGNRSAALFALGFYKECLQDIDKALKHGYPKERSSKLIKRKADAEKAQNTEKVQNNSKNVLRTYQIPESEKHHLIQSARNCIEIRTSETYGNHIVATRNIKVGEVLIVEEAYTSYQMIDDSKDPFCFCCECLKHCYNLIPCVHCQILYCSEMCREKSFKSGHKYECLIRPYINGLVNLYDLFLISLKITLLSMNEENNDETMYRSDRYKEISKLKSHSNGDALEKMFVMAEASANIFTLIKEKTKIFREYEGFEERFKELFCRHMLLAKVNGATLRSSHSDWSAIGVGLYPLFALLNHSCYPNLSWSNSGSTMIVRALSNIKEGEQCFISYIDGFDNCDRNKRLEKLQRVYKFTCRCPPCEKHWPTMEFTKIFLKGRNTKKVKAKLREAIKKLMVRDTTRPSIEILSLRDVVTEAYKILDNESQ